MVENSQKYVIGVDGGGTKTVAILADFQGKTLKRIEAGSTNPYKLGMEKATLNLKQILFKVSKSFPEKEIALAYLALAGGLERDKRKKIQIERILEKEFSFPILVEGDQRAAFCSGTDLKTGILIIAGTGSISMGWRGEKEAISGGWDWLLGDQGSAFWVGRKALENVIKSLDGRTTPFPYLKKLIFKEYKIKEEKDLYQKFYGSDFVEKIASLSKIVERASRKEKIAQEILEKAAKELAQMAAAVIKKLKFQGNFPVVLVGGMFNSKIVLSSLKKELGKIVPEADFILPKTEPAMGAVKLAIKKISKNENIRN